MYTAQNSRSENIVIEARNLAYSFAHRMLLAPLDFCLIAGETLVITGPSGSGKSILASLISGERKPVAGTLFVRDSAQIEFVKQQDNFVAESGIRVSYYSQRYENPWQEDVPTVLEYLVRKVPEAAPGILQSVLESLNVGYLSERKILSLSNGERKRLQLVCALARQTEILVLDQPFTGLDPQARKTLGHVLEVLKNKGTTLVIVSDKEHIPSFADQVLELKAKSTPEYKPKSVNDISKSSNNKKPVSGEAEVLVQMKKVSVTHGGKGILRNIDWVIRDGEKWLLRGHNGAGKSTLLSLITADHPQAYANDIVLFGRKRGSGESIWDIKKKIGFVSPELHLYFLRQRGIYKASASSELRYNAATCLDVVLSGFKDEVGFSTSTQKLQLDQAKEWVREMEIEQLEKAAFAHCSPGEQRIVLLARALIKSPALLILDEPCQGLDPLQVRHFLTLLDSICAQKHTTLVYVTHREEEIPTCITHLLELENGQIKTKGSQGTHELAL